MKPYHIINIDNQYMLVATSYVNPFDSLDEIQNEFKNKNYVGSVIFDLLLCNGLAPNRYIVYNFDGIKFDIQNCSVVTNVDNEFKKLVCSYFRANPSCIEQSILPKAQCFLLKKGYNF